MSRDLVVFDGDCAFCTSAIIQMQRWVAPDVDVIPWQFADLPALGLTTEQCQEALQFVATTGSQLAGGRAVTAILQVAPRPWPIIGRAASLPVISSVVDSLYRLVARNRYRLPGGTPACRMQDALPQSGDDRAAVAAVWQPPDASQASPVGKA